MSFWAFPGPWKHVLGERAIVPLSRFLRAPSLPSRSALPCFCVCISRSVSGYRRQGNLRATPHEWQRRSPYQLRAPPTSSQFIGRREVWVHFSFLLPTSFKASPRGPPLATGRDALVQSAGGKTRSLAGWLLGGIDWVGASRAAVSL